MRNYSTRNVLVTVKNSFDMMRFYPDGTCSMLLQDDKEGRCIHAEVSQSGIVSVRLRNSDSVVSKSFCFGGDSILVSQTINGLPFGEWVLAEPPTITVIETSENPGKAVKSRFLGVMDQVLMDFVKDIGFPICGSFLRKIGNSMTDAYIPEWSDVIPARFYIDTVIMSGSIILNDRQYELGRVGNADVILARLPKRPPRGSIELAPSVDIKQSDVWRNRFERFLEITNYPSCIMRVVGIARFQDGSFYVASELPGTFCGEEISEIPPKFCAMESIDVLECISESVRFVHSKGCTFGGRLNPCAYIFSVCGRKACLNTAYLLSGLSDSTLLLGGLDVDEIRYVTPSYFPCLSDPIRFVLQLVGSVELPTMHLLELDNYQLGLTIFCMASEAFDPFGWLSDSQFLLSCIFSNVSPMPWLSPLFKPEDGYDSSSLPSKDSLDLNAIQKIGLSILCGELSVDRLILTLRDCRGGLRESQVELSMETQIRTIFQKLSTSIWNRGDSRSIVNLFDL